MGLYISYHIEQVSTIKQFHSEFARWWQAAYVTLHLQLLNVTWGKNRISILLYINNVRTTKLNNFILVSLTGRPSDFTPGMKCNIPYPDCQSYWQSNTVYNNSCLFMSTSSRGSSWDWLNTTKEHCQFNKENTANTTANGGQVHLSPIKPLQSIPPWYTLISLSIQSSFQQDNYEQIQRCR